MKLKYIFLLFAAIILTENIFLPTGILFVIVSLFVFFNINSVSKKSLLSVSPLFIILVIGVISAKPYDYNFSKDGWYYIKPIIYLISGTLLVKHIKHALSINNLILIFSIVYSVVGSYYNIADFFTKASSNNIPYSHARYLVVYGLVIMLFKGYYLPKIEKFRVIIIMIMISFIFYSFSRSLIISFLILIFVNIFHDIKAKQIAKSLLVITVSIIVLTITNNAFVENLLSKFEFASKEIQLNNEFYNEGEVSNWRGYETNRAIDAFNKDATTQTYLFGKGFGALVDIGFYLQLGKEEMKFIPKLHNGYMEVLFKTGIIGLLLYLTFIYNIYKSIRKFPNYIFEKKMIIGLLIIIFVNTAFTTGIYNIGAFDSSLFLLGFYLAYLKTSSTKNSELQNISL